MRILLLFVAFIALYSCNNDLDSIGQDLIDNGTSVQESKYKIYSTATIKIDSFITSGGKSYNVNELFVGRYDDNFSGITVATPYFAIVPSSIPNIESSFVYDSVTFNFKHTGQIWGDTIDYTTQTLELWQLKQNADPLEDLNYYLYNTYSVPLDRKLGEVQFIPRRKSIQKTYFKLDDTFGRELWEKMKAKDDIFDNTWSFINYFHGLAIKPADNNNCIITINAVADSLYMRFHYHKTEDESYIDFKLSQKELQFNNITSTPAPLFETLTKQEIQQPFLEKDFSMIQGLSGYMVKMTLPKLPIPEAYTTIIKAELEVPVVVANQSPVGMPQRLSVYQTNNKNEIKDPLPNSISTGTVVTGVYQENLLNREDNKYIFDVTDYYQRMLKQPSATDEDYQILISVAGFGSTFDRVIIDELPVLKVYFAKYKL